MSGYDFHPEARVDLAEIWEFIRAGLLLKFHAFKYSATTVKTFVVANTAS